MAAAAPAGPGETASAQPGVKADPEDSKGFAEKLEQKPGFEELAFQARVPYFITQCKAFQLSGRSWLLCRPCCLANSFLDPPLPPEGDGRACYERLGKEGLQRFRDYVDAVGKDPGKADLAPVARSFEELLHPVQQKKAPPSEPKAEVSAAVPPPKAASSNSTSGPPPATESPPALPFAEAPAEAEAEAETESPKKRASGRSNWTAWHARKKATKAKTAKKAKNAKKAPPAVTETDETSKVQPRKRVRPRKDAEAQPKKRVRPRKDAEAQPKKRGRPRKDAEAPKVDPPAASMPISCSVCQKDFKNRAGLGMHLASPGHAKQVAFASLKPTLSESSGARQEEAKKPRVRVKAPGQPSLAKKRGSAVATAPGIPTQARRRGRPPKAAGPSTTARRRGRPPKAAGPPKAGETPKAAVHPKKAKSAGLPNDAAAKKKPGRTAKEKTAERKRGRPRKLSMVQPQADMPACGIKLKSGVPGITWSRTFWRVRVGNFEGGNFYPEDASPQELERSRLAAVRRREQLEEAQRLLCGGDTARVKQVEVFRGRTAETGKAAAPKAAAPRAGRKRSGK